MPAIKVLLKKKWHCLQPGVWIIRLLLLGLSTGIEVAGQSTGTSLSEGPDTAPKTEVPNLFKQTGTDPSFKSLLDDGTIPVGKNSTQGVKGSTIDINRTIVERGANSKNPIPKEINIHTLCNSFIPRKDFKKWTRWYQEDGNTQIFRLFKGEHNVRNSRPEAARIESFSSLKWKQGDWHEWTGTYTIVKPHSCSIFQVKNSLNDWSVMINLSDSGTIKLNHRRHQPDIIIAKQMTGKSFDLMVRDNGYDYEVYFNGEKVGTGHYSRPEGYTSFRWGMYDRTLRHDALIFVTGAKFK